MTKQTSGRALVRNTVPRSSWGERPGHGQYALSFALRLRENGCGVGERQVEGSRTVSSSHQHRRGCINTALPVIGLVVAFTPTMDH